MLKSKVAEVEINRSMQGKGYHHQQTFKIRISQVCTAVFHYLLIN